MLMCDFEGGEGFSGSRWTIISIPIIAIVSNKVPNRFIMIDQLYQPVPVPQNDHELGDLINHWHIVDGCTIKHKT